MSNWISVKERLPKAVMGPAAEERIISDDVLVYFPGGDSNYEVANYDHDARWWTLVTQKFKTADCDPTHWQPLPEPPEGKP